jgi:hypothetical protein
MWGRNLMHFASTVTKRRIDMSKQIMTKNVENMLRAERAQDALATYIDMDDTRSAVIDLLTDLRHYCDHNDIDLGAADKMAHQHYLAELSGE